MRYTRSLLYLFMVSPGIALVGCGDDGFEPSTGSIEIMTTTSGPVAVSEYAFTVNFGPDQPIGLNARVTVPNVPAGNNVVLLIHPPECAVEGEAHRTVSVNPGELARVAFVLTCVAPAVLQ